MVAVFLPIHTTDWGRAHHVQARAQISAHGQAGPIEHFVLIFGPFLPGLLRE